MQSRVQVGKLTVLCLGLASAQERLRCSGIRKEVTLPSRSQRELAISKEQLEDGRVHQLQAEEVRIGAGSYISDYAHYALTNVT